MNLRNFLNVWSDQLSSNYSVLYNYVAFKKSALDILLESNDNEVIQHCVNKSDSVLFTNTHNITVEQVKHAIHKLEPGKSDCINGIVSDNFKNGTKLLFTLIPLTHGIALVVYYCQKFKIFKIKSGNCCNSDNYDKLQLASF